MNNEWYIVGAERPITGDARVTYGPYTSKQEAFEDMSQLYYDQSHLDPFYSIQWDPRPPFFIGIYENESVDEKISRLKQEGSLYPKYRDLNIETPK